MAYLPGSNKKNIDFENSVPEHLFIQADKNAISTVAEACMPMVPLNKSIIIPKRKARINNSQPGVSKGKSKINNT